MNDIVREGDRTLAVEQPSSGDGVAFEVDGRGELDAAGAMFQAIGEHIVKPFAESNARAEVEKARSRDGVQAKALERDIVRLGLEKQRFWGKWGFAVVALVAGLAIIAFAIDRNQTSVALEIVKLGSVAAAGALGGYGYAKTKRD